MNTALEDAGRLLAILIYILPNRPPGSTGRLDEMLVREQLALDELEIGNRCASPPFFSVHGPNIDQIQTIA